MIDLRCIAQHYVDAPELPAAARAVANMIIVGIIFLNGFAGRCLEWSLLSLQHVVEQTSKGLDYVVCKNHKTSRVYGDLAKWLAPGTVAAMECYAGLPRDGNITSFLVPTNPKADHVVVPECLVRFSKKYLPIGFTRPTVNLLRKYFHTALINMTSTHDALLNVMRKIDAHSTSVALNHYVLRDPEADAKLARVLVSAVLGETVPWPGQDTLGDVQIACKALLEFASSKAYAATGGEIDDLNEPDDMELDWWDAGAAFGVPVPLDVITDVPSQDPEPSSAHQLIAADEIDVQSVRVHSGSSCGSAGIVAEAQSTLPVASSSPFERVVVKDGATFPMEETASSAPSDPIVAGSSSASAAPPEPPVLSSDGASAQTEGRNATSSAATPNKSAARPKKVPHRYSSSEVDWILAQHKEHQGAAHDSEVASTKWFESLFERGVRTESLSPLGSSQGCRSVVQRYVFEQKETRAHNEFLAERRRQYATKKLRKE